MKTKIIILLCFMFIGTSCSITLPLQTNLNDNTLLMSKNKDIKVEYVVVSNVKDGFVTYKHEQKNGAATENNQYYKYAVETGLKSMWKNYFESKFNEYSNNQINVKIIQSDFYLKEQLTTALGLTMLTGNTQSIVEVHSTLKIVVIYQDKTYQKDFNIVSNGYQESQSMQMGNYRYTKNYINPTAQKSQLIQDCYNKGIVLFENYINSIIIEPIR